MHPIASRILSPQVNRHKDTQHSSHRLKHQQRTVAWVVGRRILRQIQIGRNGSAHVAKSHVHSNTNAALQGPTDVVAVPGNALGDVRIDTAGEEETAGVFDVVVCYH
jgi:hypothetical protein